MVELDLVLAVIVLTATILLGLWIIAEVTR